LGRTEGIKEISPFIEHADGTREITAAAVVAAEAPQSGGRSREERRVALPLASVSRQLSRVPCRGSVVCGGGAALFLACLAVSRRNYDDDDNDDDDFVFHVSIMSGSARS
jgi:glycine/D-amino acid oxidase-like deaminating enzyme